jgi:hypothetical protein
MTENDKYDEIRCEGLTDLGLSTDDPETDFNGRQRPSAILMSVLQALPSPCTILGMDRTENMARRRVWGLKVAHWCDNSHSLDISFFDATTGEYISQA